MSSLIGVILLIVIFGLAAVYIERKVAAFIQDRMGPIHVGPKGVFQTIADILKLIQKERIIPSDANRILFLLGPIILFLSIFVGYVFVPFSSQNALQMGTIPLLFIIGVLAIDVVGILFAGWGSNNKYALIGAIRSVSQLISYGVPTGLSILSVVVLYNTLDINEINYRQSSIDQNNQWFFYLLNVNGIGGILSWSVFRYPHLFFSFIIFFISSLAECNRAPFDLPEGESELIGGYHTEYSGFLFAIMFLGEYAKMLLLSIVAVFLFFGGTYSPFPNFTLSSDMIQYNTYYEIIKAVRIADLTNGINHTFFGWFMDLFWLFSKAFLLILIMMWIRWTYPRLRADQLIKFCWKTLTPFAILFVFMSILIKLFEIYRVN